MTTTREVQLDLTEEEVEFLTKQAKEHNNTLEEYIDQIVLEYLKDLKEIKHD